MDELKKSVKELHGVGEKTYEKIKRLKLKTIEDLIWYFPKEYEDRSDYIKLRECPLNAKGTFYVEILEEPVIQSHRKNMDILKVAVTDGESRFFLSWFNQNYLKNRLRVGYKYTVNGKLVQIGRELQITNPIIGTKEEIAKIQAVYGLTEGLGNKELKKIIDKALEQYLVYVKDMVPKTISEKYGFMSIEGAIYTMHNPKDRDSLIRARNRLVFQEFLSLQTAIFTVRNRNTLNDFGIQYEAEDESLKFIENLPFKLTEAQKKVYLEIKEDMESKTQMNRLVQGDVGSGKTVVVVIAMYKAFLSGYQSAMMAPTEILARQHVESLNEFYSDYGVKVELLIGSLKESEKKDVLNRLKNGDIDILVGTHALIQDLVEFKNLGLVITDEQHRFGVKQRAVLEKKGDSPDILVMTATPIPRTLSLIFYGDLDISIIDELPPGRKEIETYAVGTEMVSRINSFIIKQLEEGRQIYVVSPLIEENEVLDLKSAEKIYSEFKNHVFKDYSVGLLHGKMKASEKDEIMNDFKSGRIQIIVSTTVIEVGVNVPNANVMVVYNAERFGLAQLHQLRGRVGRGEYQSYCIFINEGQNKIARERMRVLQDTTDGFKISEKDLELRGPGEFLGVRQHGLPSFKLANIILDLPILKLVQKEAEILIKDDPNLIKPENFYLRKEVNSILKEIKSDISLN